MSRDGSKLPLEPFTSHKRFDRREMIEPLCHPVGTDPKATTRSAALRIIRDFMRYGTANHDSTGGPTGQHVWVLVAWAEANEVPYRIDGKWGYGYTVTRIGNDFSHGRRRV